MLLEYFQMIDEVVALNRGDGSIIARSSVPDASPVFEGHFPTFPLVPGVLLVETMAQACGFLVLARNDFSRMPLLASVKDAKFRAPVSPQDGLVIEAAMEHDGSGFAVMQARIRKDERAVCDATLNLKTMPFPTEELRDHIRSRAEGAGLFALDG